MTKRAFVLLVVLLVVAFIVYKTKLQHDATFEEACAVMESKCNDDGFDVCDDLRDVAGAKVNECVVDSSTCIEAEACIKGAEIEAMRKGLERVLN